MTFQEGQEVEVNELYSAYSGGVPESRWRKAKIVSPTMHTPSELYTVQFPDGTIAIVDAEHIRPISSGAP